MPYALTPPTVFEHRLKCRYVNRVSSRAMGQTLNESEMSDLLGDGEDADEGGQEGRSGTATNVTVRDRWRLENDVEIKMTSLS